MDDLMRNFEQVLNPMNAAAAPVAPVTPPQVGGLAGLFPQVGMPVAPQPVVQAPVQAAPQGGWQELLWRLQNDPLMRKAALAAAVPLSAGPQGQESTMSHLTRSYATGAGVYDQAKDAAEKEALAKAARERAAKTADLRDEALKVETAGRTVKQAQDLAGVTEEQELTPLKKKRLEAEIAKLEREGNDAPRLRELQDRLHLAQLRSVQAQEKTARGGRNPAAEARDVFMDTFKMSPEGQLQEGETEEQRTARAAQAYLQKGHRPQVGAMVNYRTQLANDLLMAKNDPVRAAELQAQIAAVDAEIKAGLQPGGKKLGAGVQPATGAPLGAARQDVSGQVVKKVRTQEELNALPPGTRFDFNGRTGVMK